MGIKFFKRVEYRMCTKCDGVGYVKQQNVRRWVHHICTSCQGKGMIPVEAFKVRLQKTDEEDSYE